ncbi:hypothetical protein HVY71_12465 [Citrobacter freundii]|uniref:hypothetical protein n=1 Tax=Citrobacter portucalensis TaxID=1639133 RepID=UPI0015EA9A8D|nr:hypothetical protein HVY71_12465 [Citrobacter freundii]
MGFGINGGGGSSSGSSTSDSTNHSYTWNSSMIEQFMNSYDPDIYYQGHSLVGPNSVMTSLENYWTDPARYQQAQAIINKGKGIAGQGMDILSTMAGYTPEQYMDAITGMAGDIYGMGSDWQAGQDEAIENNVMATMGSTLAQNAETQNAGGAVAGSSAMNNSAMGILSGGAQSMESQEAALANKMMGAATGMAGSVLSTYGKAQREAASTYLGIGGNVIGAGTNAEKSALNNAWKVGVLQNGGAQVAQMLNRQDNMVFNNMDFIDSQIWLDEMLKTAGIDTTSYTHTTGSSSGSNKHGGFSASI